MKIKQLLIKYLVVAVGIVILGRLLYAFVPDFFVRMVLEDGVERSKLNFIGLFQGKFLNLVPAVLMVFDLRKTGQNWLVVVVPILTVLSLIPGLFFFSIVILYHLMNSYEQI